MPQSPNREQELIGGLKNALDRGETIDSAKQSFVNAGYAPTEIESAIQKMPQTTSQASKQIVAPTQNNTSVVIPGEKKKLSKTFKIILAIVSVIILISATVLGLFWDKASTFLGPFWDKIF